MPTYAPFAHPLYVMLKPAGSLCNLNCDYCYYTEKGDMYRSCGAGNRMTISDELLEKFTRQYIEAQTQPQVLFTWHGGEPLMRPISFYEKALRLQRQYARGHIIDNCLQTNGTLLTDEWCEFFRRNNFLIGISIDGPKEFHDEYRRTRTGGPCDHFVFPEYRLGNIHTETLTSMMYGRRQQAFGEAKRAGLPGQCRECGWLKVCNGGCPKDRFLTTSDGEPGLNYMCSAYRRYFAHTAPYMDFMRNELLNRRPPANVMQWARTRDTHGDCPQEAPPQSVND